MEAQLGVSDSTVNRVLKTAGQVTFRGAPKSGDYCLTHKDDEEPKR